jgi:N-acetylglucosamine-6-sulfatase
MPVVDVPLSRVACSLRRLGSVAAIASAGACSLAACATGGLHGPAAPAMRTATGTARRPNIVFVLTDDLSWDLVRFMPEVRRLEGEGMTFTHYFVTDSLCCPSRASIFTGELPHDTGVRTNAPPSGGYPAFLRHGDETHTFARQLRGAGYRTAIMGKYLNGYRPADGPVRPGWTRSAVPGNGYPEFGYTMSVDGRDRHYGHRPRAYLTDVLARRGARFIRRSGRSGRPFALEVATFAPHKPATPAPRDRHALRGLGAPHGPAFDAHNRRAPRWLGNRPRLSPRMIARLDREYRRRARSVLAVDDLLRRLRRTLNRQGLSRDTEFVFSSDNGYHMGQHRLAAGKMTAFDSDIRVPLVVAGPGVPAGTRTAALAENIDLAPTFTALGGAPPPPGAEGRSLVPILRGEHPRRWRGAVLVEHTRPAPSPLDPDRQGYASGDPPSYEAIRTRRGIYVEYADGGREWYDHRTDPHELDNAYATLSPGRRARLHHALRAMARCHGADECRRASLLRGR